MRLDPSEITAITATAAEVFGSSATVRLFGSRADDRRRGGDIDLYIEVDPGRGGFPRECEFHLKLEDEIGEQSIDVIVHERGTPLRPIERIAEETGIVLNEFGAGDAVDDRQPRPPSRSNLCELLHEALTFGRAVARRLTASRQRLARTFPMDVERFGRLDDEECVLIDAMQKQVESLHDILERSVFRSLLILQDEDVAEMTRRDIVNWMEDLEIIRSAAEWRALADLRKRLSHEYPLTDGEQVECFNQVYTAIELLLHTLNAVEGYVAQGPHLNVESHANPC